MPAKKHTLTDAERAKRIRETAREIKTDQSSRAFERAFEKVVSRKPSSRLKSGPRASREEP
jgi:hypothetical protein